MRAWLKRKDKKRRVRDIFLAAAGMIYSAFANEQEQENAIAWFNDNFEWRECASVRRGTVAVCATACTTIGAAASLAAVQVMAMMSALKKRMCVSVSGRCRR